MTLRQHIWFWVGLVTFSLFLLGVLSEILLPFVAGMAVAYFLDPVADRLESIGLSRVMATTIITIIFFIILALSILLLIPMIANQVLDLIEAAPGYIDSTKVFIKDLLEGPLKRFLPGDGAASSELFEGLRQRALTYGSTVLQGVARGSGAFLSFMGLLFITPVVSFYLLNDWDRIVIYVDKLLPRQNADTIRKIASEIDRVLAGFVRGMGTICVVLAIFYAVALEVAGLKFGLVVGIIAGVVSFIPFVGMAVGLVLSMALAIFQFLPGDPISVVIIFGIFVTGQVLEGNILTPKLVGSRIGLHPVWVIFGLLAFGSLFGFVGMLLAVPVAAVIGVVVRHFTAEYLKSPLYWGIGAPIGTDLEMTGGSPETGSLLGLEASGADAIPVSESAQEDPEDDAKDGAEDGVG